MTRSERRELSQLVHDIDDSWTMLQATIRDRQWLFAALTLTGLNDKIEKLRSLLESKL